MCSHQVNNKLQKLTFLYSQLINLKLQNSLLFSINTSKAIRLFLLAKNMNQTVQKHPIHKYTLPLSQRFPQDIDYIIRSPHPDHGSLLVSNIQAAENPALVQRFKIRAIVSCAKGYELNHLKSIVPHYHYLPAVDHESCDIYTHFQEATNFIAQNLTTTNVLVHCVAGVSRSVTIVMAYLIRWHSLSFSEAYSFVRSRRKIVNPNKGFLQQLKRYHFELRSNSFKMTKELYFTPAKRPEKEQKKTASTLNRQKQEASELYRKYKLDEIKQKYNENIFLSIENQRNEHNQDYIRRFNDKPQNSFEEKYMSQYYRSLKTVQQVNDNNMKRPPNSSFFTRSQDLQLRITKIKQKYESHIKMLQDKLQARRNNFLDKKTILENAQIEKESIQSGHEYPRNARYLNGDQNVQLMKKVDARIARSLTAQNIKKYKKNTQNRPKNGIQRSFSAINKNKSIPSSVDNNLFLNSNLNRQKSATNAKIYGSRKPFGGEMRVHGQSGVKRYF